MKKNFVLILLFLTGICFAYEKVYLNQPSTYRTNYFYRPAYNPYNSYYNPYYSTYNYRRANRNNINRLRRLQKIKRLNRIINLTLNNNQIAWFNNKGTLTGYSVPIKKDAYDQMGIAPYNTKKGAKQTASPTCNTDLFSSPMGDEMYYRNGEYSKNIGGTAGKTGVTIIYD